MNEEHLFFDLSKILVSSLELEMTLPKAAKLVVDRLSEVWACFFFSYSEVDGGLELLAEAGSFDVNFISDIANSFYDSDQAMLIIPTIEQSEGVFFQSMRSGFSVGVICFIGKQLQPVIELLKQSAEVIASTIYNSVSYRNVITERSFFEQFTRETTVLYQLTHSLSTTFKSSEVIENVLQGMSNIFRAEVQALLLVAGEVGSLYFNFLTHFDIHFFHLLQKKVEKIWTATSKNSINIEKKRVIHIPDANINTKGLNITQESQIRSWLSAPLAEGDRIFGLLCVASVKENRFRDYHKEFLHIVAGLSAKVIENTRLNEKLKAQATTDGLTGIYNHRTFQEKLEEHFALAKRYQLPLSLIMIDIDHFKKFNDIYGHQIGDEVLRLVAQALCLSTRDVDIICRYGGEEFVLILPQIQLPDARLVAERLRSEINKREFIIGDSNLRITVSLGISAYPVSKPEDKQDLIAKADTMLYLAKKAGRNRVVVWPGPNGGELTGK